MTSVTAPHFKTDHALRGLVESAFSPGELQDIVGGLELSPARLRRGLADPVDDFVSRPSKHFRATMVGLGFAAVGAGGPMPADLPQLVELVHGGSLIVDDIEDASEERRGAPALHRVHGVARALNAGNWMYFLALRRAYALGLDETTAARLQRSMVEAMYRCHVGQALDLDLDVHRVPQAATVTTSLALMRLKTGALMSLAMELGAIAAGAPPERVTALATVGRDFGVALQMLDDIGNLSDSSNPAKRAEDLKHGRLTWVWATAARDLDELTYRRLLDRLRGAQGGGPAADSSRALLGLGDELTTKIAPSARAGAHALLERALAADVLRDAPQVREGLRSACAALEASYG